MAEPHRLLLADVVPGTRLAGDLVDTDGAMLLTAGTRLDRTLLATLAQHGIATVPVAGDDAPASGAMPGTMPARAAEIRAALEKRIAGSNPASRALLETVLAYRLEGRKG